METHCQVQHRLDSQYMPLPCGDRRWFTGRTAFVATSENSPSDDRFRQTAHPQTRTYGLPFHEVDYPSPTTVLFCLICLDLAGIALTGYLDYPRWFYIAVVLFNRVILPWVALLVGVAPFLRVSLSPTIRLD
jgi:hypothetical protein